MDIYSRIEGLCNTKNEGSILKNGIEPTPRVKYITSLLKESGIDYYVDKFKHRDLPCYNIIVPGSGKQVVMAHHDIVNPRSDNANDNSCSIICAIALKKLVPTVTLAFVDGEEMGGIGSTYLSKRIKDGELGTINWVLNLELSGRGGKNFFIGTTGSKSKLRDRIIKLFPDTPEIGVPFNDSKILRGQGIDSININPTPSLEDGELDLSPLDLCHSMEDSVDKVSQSDMKTYVEEVLVPICRPQRFSSWLLTKFNIFFKLFS
jgi:hypothetical protein